MAAIESECEAKVKKAINHTAFKTSVGVWMDNEGQRREVIVTVTGTGIGIRSRDRQGGGGGGRRQQIEKSRRMTRDMAQPKPETPDSQATAPHVLAGIEIDWHSGRQGSADGVDMSGNGELQVPTCILTYPLDSIEPSCTCEGCNIMKQGTRLFRSKVFRPLHR